MNEERRTCKLGSVEYKDFKDIKTSFFRQSKIIQVLYFEDTVFYKYKEITQNLFICLYFLVLIRTKVSMVSVLCVWYKLSYIFYMFLQI
jgi:hypothetical protein